MEMASQATPRRFPDINSQSTGLNPTCPIPDTNRLRQPPSKEKPSQHPQKQKCKKVTTSQDDGFVRGWKIQLVGYAEDTYFGFAARKRQQRKGLRPILSTHVVPRLRRRKH